MLQFVRQITEKSRPRSIGPGKAAIETTSCSPGNLRGSADFIDSSPGPRCCPGRRRRPVVLRFPGPGGVPALRRHGQEGSLRSDPSGAAIQSKRTVIRKEVPGDISFHIETNRHSMTPLQRNLKQNTIVILFTRTARWTRSFSILFSYNYHFALPC